MPIRRYINRTPEGYWVHVDGDGPEAGNKPFRLTWGPYRWGIAALFRFWIQTKGTNDDLMRDYNG